MKPDPYLSPDDAGRRDLMPDGVLATVAAVVPNVAAAATERAAKSNATSSPVGARIQSSDRITTKDGVVIYYKDWGSKDDPVVTLSHGWSLCRRGHGRSSQPWNGNDMDHYADDLAAVIETLNLKQVTVIGFSTDGGEVTR